MSKAILNFADQRFVHGQKRLRASLHGKFDGTLLFYTDPGAIPCPPHKLLSYGFKAAIVEKALQSGVRFVLWIDSSVYVRHNINLIFQRIEQDGYFLLNQGNELGGRTLGEWCSDDALGVFGISRDEACTWPSCYGTVFGLDLHKNKDFLDEYLKLSKDPNVMNGPWHNHNNAASVDNRVQGHRHDQTLLSYLTWKHNMRNYILGDEAYQFISGYYDNYKNPESVLVFTPV
jgi:hypothetical protein